MTEENSKASSNHAQRVVTASFLIAAILIIVVALPPVYFAGAMLGAALLAAFEYGKLLQDTTAKALISPLAVLALILPFSLGTYTDWGFPALDPKAWISVAVVWWVLMVILVAAFSEDFYEQPNFRYLLHAHAIISLSAFWLAMANFEHVKVAGLYLITLVAICDTAAYYSGKRWGKERLCPEISAGKTREGLWGALAATLLFTIAVGAFASLPAGLWINLTFLSLLICLISVVGDLSASMAKRYAGAKDSGSILAGHGGVLDRIDGLVAAAPCFWLGFQFIRGG